MGLKEEWRSPILAGVDNGKRRNVYHIFDKLSVVSKN